MRVRLATGMGLAMTIGGIVLFSVAIVTSDGSVDLPPPLWAASFYGGLSLIFLGPIVGVRYGNMERYHDHYDEETGRIEGHPVGRVLDALARDNTAGEAPPEKFVPPRALLASITFLPSVGAIAFLRWMGDFEGLMLALATVMLLGGSAVAFVVAELMARDTYEDYA